MGPPGPPGGFVISVGKNILPTPSLLWITVLALAHCQCISAFAPSALAGPFQGVTLPQPVGWQEGPNVKMTVVKSKSSPSWSSARQRRRSSTSRVAFTLPAYQIGWPKVNPHPKKFAFARATPHTHARTHTRTHAYTQRNTFAQSHTFMHYNAHVVHFSSLISPLPLLVPPPFLPPFLPH